MENGARIWRVTRTISTDRTTFLWMQTDSLLLKGGEKSHFARRLAVSLPYPVNPLMTEEGYDQRASRVQPLPHMQQGPRMVDDNAREHGLLGMNRLGPATRRAYDSIRHRLAHLEVRPGGRIEPLMVADELSISVTPVRDALHILAGEHLVDLRHGDGYFAFPMEEADLRELYDWNQELVLSALRAHTVRHSAARRRL
ncbi:GntR family transcriptional regulator [Novosphingobium resinovorum]